MQQVQFQFQGWLKGGSRIQFQNQTQGGGNPVQVPDPVLAPDPTTQFQIQSNCMVGGGDPIPVPDPVLHGSDAMVKVLYCGNGGYDMANFMDLRVGRELSFFKKLRSNPVFTASIKVLQQLISFKWFQILKYV